MFDSLDSRVMDFLLMVTLRFDEGLWDVENEGEWRDCVFDSETLGEIEFVLAEFDADVDRVELLVAEEDFVSETETDSDEVLCENSADCVRVASELVAENLTVGECDSEKVAECESDSVPHAVPLTFGP